MSENLNKQSEETKPRIIVPGLVHFRLCKLEDDDLLKKIGEHTDAMYKTGRLPSRHIPARPDEDFDLLVGELMVRYINKENATNS